MSRYNKPWAQGGVIDITTRGRNTGQPRRIEIRFHHIEGQVYITGRPPRRRDWYANLLAHPEFTFHLKESLQADLPARATPILDQARRRAIIAAIHQKRGTYQDVEAWVEHGPWWPWNSWSSELAADMASQEAGVAGVATRGTCPPGAGQVYLRAGK